jgi:hypothetical protein
VGQKQVRGKKTDEMVIIVYVKNKKPLEAVPEGQRIPAEIRGVKTDVVERRFELKHLLVRVEDLRLRADTGTYDPLRGGISIGPCRSVFISGPDVACHGVPAAGNYVFVGTLGTFVRDNATGSEMMLSNFHVMALDNAWSAGDAMAQPSLVDGGNCPADVVGQLQRASLGGQVDGAIASHSARGFACEIVDIGAVAGEATATVGMAVRKRGRTTGLTHGTVDDVALSVNIDYCNGLGTVTLTNQIGIAVDTSQSTQFGNGGDSGSVVVDNTRRVVGLYFAGTEDGTYGVANPIQAVMSALNVSICVPPTFKFIDDPTLKFADDPTLKFADDVTRKFADDPTLKFADDVTMKFADDPVTLKFVDDGGTDPRLDPYKTPALDKPPELDFGKLPAADFPGRPPLGGPQAAGTTGAAPFVLATPHHSLAFTGQSPQQLQAAQAQCEAALREREQALTKMYEAYQRGAMNTAEYQQFLSACTEYQALLAQYRQLFAGR